MKKMRIKMTNPSLKNSKNSVVSTNDYLLEYESKLGKRKEPKVEIWNKEKKEWVKKNQSLL
jgi:hypothetical protein